MKEQTNPSIKELVEKQGLTVRQLRTGLRETLQSFAPSLPMFGAGKLRGKLSAAQSSIGSALSAMDSRAESEQTLREYGSRWRSLEAEYRARSNI